MSRTYLPRSWVNPKLAPGKSAIHGQGVFARQDIKEGERLMEFGGALVPREEAFSGNYRYRSIWPIGEDRFLALPLSDEQPSLDENLNHSCDANSWLADEVTLTARRHIRAGEELTLDQAIWDSEGPYIEDGSPCSCGAANCRGILTEQDWKRPDVQERYRGHFHPMIGAAKDTR